LVGKDEFVATIITRIEVVVGVVSVEGTLGRIVIATLAIVVEAAEAHRKPTTAGLDLGAEQGHEED
jgi:hypothetical protein